MTVLFIILTLLGLIYGIGGKIANKLSKLNREEFDRNPIRGRSAPVVYNFKFTNVVTILSSVIFISYFIFWNFIAVIDAQSVGVVTTPNGVKPTAMHTGWRLVLPWYDVHHMDKTIWVYTCAKGAKDGNKEIDDDAIWAPTSEGIKMGFDISASWKIDPDQAPWIYQNVTPQDGDENSRYLWLEENVIRTKLKSSLALTVSDYTPIETYSSKRQEIQDNVLKKMKSDLKQWRVILEQIDIREVYYDPQYEAEIKNKKVEEQRALTLIEVTKQTQELLKQETIKKDIAIQKAEGEAKSLQIKGNSISSNPKIIELEWINKWDGVLPIYVMGEGGNTMMMISPNK